MNEVTNSFGLIWNFVYMIYVKETFNSTMNFKKTLYNQKLLNGVIVDQSLSKEEKLCMIW